MGARPGREPRALPSTQAPARTPKSLRSPDLGAVLQAIRLHFVTDFWTLPADPPPFRSLLQEEFATSSG